VISRIRVVVVAWNSGRTLDRCISAIRGTHWPSDQLEIVVVDNGSTDDSTRDWGMRHPGVELRQTGANLGFGGGANRALDDLEGVDAVALVNPDAFVEPDWLEPLVDALERDDAIGAACPKILLEPRPGSGLAVINNVGNELGRRREPHDRGLGEQDQGQYDRPEDVWGWCGGGVLLRTSYIQCVGRFDERLFLYCEDVDLSWKGRNLGWRYRYVPWSRVHHVHRASSGGERTPLLDYLNRRNRLVVVSRHGDRGDVAVAWTRTIGGALLAGALALSAGVRRHPVDAHAMRRRVRAAWDAVRLLRGQEVQIPAAIAAGTAVEPVGA